MRGEAGYVHIIPGGGVRCCDCEYDRPITWAPWLCRCAAGVMPAAAAGHWRSDPRHCESYIRRAQP